MLRALTPLVAVTTAVTAFLYLGTPALSATGQPYLQSGDRVVFAGDSITYLGVNETNTLGWIEQFKQLAESQFSGLKIYDSGVPGDTSASLLTRFNNSVLNVAPSVVVIWIGVNDIDGNTAPSITQQNIQALVQRALGSTSVREVILVSPECSGEKRDGQNAHDTQIDQLASFLYQQSTNDASGRVFYCPMRADWNYEELKVNTTDAASGVLTIDGLHPSVLGNSFLREVFASEFGLRNSTTGSTGGASGTVGTSPISTSTSSGTGVPIAGQPTGN